MGEYYIDGEELKELRLLVADCKKSRIQDELSGFQIYSE